MNPMQDYDILLRLALLGKSGVGKSSLLAKFDDPASECHDIHNTVGVDMKTYYVVIDEKVVKVIVTDTAGQEKFQSLCAQYIRNSDGILLVYDVTDKESFDQIESLWMKYVRENSTRPLRLSLIGNKIDLNEKQVINMQDAQNLARRLDASFLETSAVTNVNVRECFQAIAKDVFVRSQLESFGNFSTTAGNATQAQQLQFLKTRRSATLRALYSNQQQQNMNSEGNGNHFCQNQMIIKRNTGNSQSFTVQQLRKSQSGNLRNQTKMQTSNGSCC